MLERVPGLGNVAQIVLCEHEHWDGSGYPQGLSGEDIPLASRIILACDAYDAMTLDRPWRGALKPWAAVRELRAGAGPRVRPPGRRAADRRAARVARPPPRSPAAAGARRARTAATPARVAADAPEPLPAAHASVVLPFWAFRPLPCLKPCAVRRTILGTPRGGERIPMAKDTEKLIRQLSLISFLMAERRPVSALEIKQDVEGYSEMNDDAFARRFYADRAELEALGIDLKVEKPPEGYFEAELYTLPPENFYLPPIEFTDGELAALQTSLVAARRPLRLRRAAAARAPAALLGPAEPARLAASSARSRWPSRLRPAAASSPSGWPRSRPRSPAARRSSSTTTRSSATRSRSARSTRTTCSTRAASSTSSGYSHERDDIRVFRLSRIREKVSYATKAEHDFTTPDDFDPWGYAHRADWQLGDPVGTAQVWISERIAWLVERDFGRYGSIEEATQSRASSGGRRSRRVPGPGRRLHDRVRAAAPADRVGARARRARAAARPAGAGRRGRRAPRRDRRAPRRPSPISSPSRSRRTTCATDVDPAENGNATVERNGARRGADPPRALRAPGRAGRDPDPGRPRGPQAERRPRSASASR